MIIEEILKNNNLTPKNRKIAQYIIDHSDQIAFMSATAMAKELNISDATIIRFARGLGYEGYTDMKSSIQNDIVKSLKKPYPYADSPGEKLKNAAKGEGESLVNLVVNSSVENIETCIKKNSEQLFAQASQAIAESRSTTVIGFWGCAPLAHYLWIKLGYLCDNINLIEAGGPEYFSRLFALDEKDVVIVFATGRYPRYSSIATEIARKNHCKIILISDKDICPLKEYADYLLVAPNNGVSFSNAMAPLLVCEILCNMVTELTWSKREVFHGHMECLLKEIDYFEDKTSSYHDT